MRAEAKRQSLRLKQDQCNQILDVRYRNGLIQCLVVWQGHPGSVWGDYAEWKHSESFVHCLRTLCTEARLRGNWTLLLDVEMPEDEQEEKEREKQQRQLAGKSNRSRVQEIIDRELDQFDEVEFHCYCILYGRALATGFVGPNFLAAFMEKRRVARYQRRREKQLANLTALSRRISELAGVSVTFENKIDFEEPHPFNYINECFSTDLVIPDDPIIGCECRSCNMHRECCPNMAGHSSFPYRKDGTLVLEQGKAIYECNRRCRCDARCQNRVVQHGPTVPFVVFKTPDRGWGIRVTSRLRAGQFVCEYAGEVIDCGTADARGKEYDNIGLTYLFDLDYNNSDRPHSVDAYHHGNMSRFINHSCDPNCAIWAVYIDCLDPNLPKLGIFTRRSIEAGEELTFDYNVGSGGGGAADVSLEETSGSPKKVSQIGRCYCKSKKCRTYLFNAAV